DRDTVAGGVRAEPHAMTEHVPGEVLDVLRIYLGAPAVEQRPHLDDASPADRRARRRAEIDGLLDQLGRRSMVPLGFRVVRSRGADEPPDVSGERFVQE